MPNRALQIKAKIPKDTDANKGELQLSWMWLLSVLSLYRRGCLHLAVAVPGQRWEGCCVITKTVPSDGKSNYKRQNKKKKKNSSEKERVWFPQGIILSWKLQGSFLGKSLKYQKPVRRAAPRPQPEPPMLRFGRRLQTMAAFFFLKRFPLFN